MTSRHIFISFSHEDLNDVNLLRGQAKNPYSSLQFDDYSVKEPFNSINATYIKSKIKEKIDRCSITMVYLTNQSALSEWVNWEILESIKNGKRIFGVYKGNLPPRYFPRLFQQNKYPIVRWNHDSIMNLITRNSW